MKLFCLLLMLVSVSSVVVAQCDPIAFISAGRGLVINRGGDLWQPGTNTNVAAGYRILPGLLLAGYFDYTPFSFHGDYQNLQSSGSSSLTSLFAGAKVSATIPGNIASPYFQGFLGWSSVASNQDTVFTNHHGVLQVFGVSHGNTFTYLIAVGADLAIYKGVFAFAEFRASRGSDINLYDSLLTWRAGLGFNFF